MVLIIGKKKGNMSKIIQGTKKLIPAQGKIIWPQGYFSLKAILCYSLSKMPLNGHF